ncbi:MAG: hypothetical protein IJA35_02150 [Clostridia bacterium]|nr:hypothetical protein [Clostridia bacterium]
MDNIEIGMLLDCYGGLLTERQRQILEQSVYDDCSLAEIAEREGISRQGVRDVIIRGSDQLVHYENVLGINKKKRAVLGYAEDFEALLREYNSRDYDSLGADRKYLDALCALIRGIKDIMEE